ncbi:MprA protease, GlyGly-CTERM protein-sorting domain-containing form [Cupriavidus metallidurans]|uniref:MprA protease, GlyGly-CTERM protein-sorting domain-containing form n=1 Tax=Cupriavidus metallidurans TaxID=119219 RepID=UPI00068B743B|nr:MprA protease, GlyGly-CTERM protein-sorting domain-containing form [Cupriavidus metallidurans]
MAFPLVAVMFGAVSPAHAQKRNPSEVPSAPVVQLIVKESGAIRSAAAINGRGDEMRRIQQWSAAALQPLTSKRVMSGGARILRLSTPLTASDAAAVAQRLRATGAFDYVDVDYRVHVAGVAANDTYLSQQWNLSPATSSRGGADVLAAWQRMPTGGSVTVAVVDTGITAHEDLDASRLAAGYDFLTAETLTTTADAKTGKFLPTGFVKNDGIADRDTDPSDPGDWVTADDATNYPDLCGPAVPSSWHGTYVSGIIAATRGNGLGIAGITPFARISNARVLGRCGGVTSDLIDAMRWAAGIAVPGVPLNAEPAKVINLSLGGYSPCGPALQQAVNDVRARGVVIVAATGNDAAMGAGAPANCSGVIGVTAHTPEGDSADYANVGTGTMLSAPGGGRGVLMTGSQLSVLSTVNLGTTTPTGSGYGLKTGTSIAAPHVTGVAAMLLSENASLTPDDIASLLTQSARPFPAGSWCQSRPGTCGAGMLDADSALALLSGQPVVHVAASADTVQPGATLTLYAKGAPGFNVSGATIQWSQTTGPAVSITPVPSDSSSATAVLPTVGTYSFVATIRNDAGSVATDTVTVAATDPASVSPGNGATGGVSSGGSDSVGPPPAAGGGAGGTASQTGGSGGGGAISPVLALLLLFAGGLGYGLRRSWSGSVTLARPGQ